MTDSESDQGLKLPSRCASVNLYSCHYQGCDKKFQRPSRLETHLLAHSGERPFKCNLCDKDFTRNAHLKRHKQINHEGVKTPTAEVNCEHCGNKFANKYSLKKHVKKTHDVKQYDCDVCGKQFHKNHLLKVHKLEHSGDVHPHKCNQCEKQFKYPGQLKRHERIHKGYVCDICNLTLEKWTDLQQHKAVEHVEPKSTELEIHKCDICEKQFRSKMFLKKHHLIHKETRETFHCPTDFCPRWFYFKSNLAQHIRSFHEGKKYLCSQSGCTSKFTTRQKLLEHLKTVHQDSSLKIKKPRKPQRRRKDKGSFKTPMASLLTGVDCSGAKSLLDDESRPLDTIDNIAREVGELITSASEVSDNEASVVCHRGRQEDMRNVIHDPNLILANMKRYEPGKHFNRVKMAAAANQDSSDTDCDTDHNTVVAQEEPKKAFDFSRFMKS